MGNCEVIRWKRFSHNSYSVFCSMHKVVNIGVLSAAIIANVDVKASEVHEVQNQPQIYESLEDVEVTAEKLQNLPGETTLMTQKEITTAAQQSVNDVLKQIPDIDVRQRGGYGVQTDISIKGAPSEQTVLSVNGINITSPHTGHLSADFPFTTNAITQIKLSEGKGSQETLHLLIEPDTITQFTTTAIAGWYGLVASENTLNISNKKNTAHLLNGAISRSDGAVQNSDFGQGKFFYLGQYYNDQINTEWQLGYSRKSFGANTFYSAAYDNQWERTNRILTSAKIELLKPLNFEAKFSWGRDYDHFQLVRGENFGENFHRTDMLSVSPKIKKAWKLGETFLMANYRHESILSTNLGVPMENDSVAIWGVDNYYRKSKERDLLDILLDHQFTVKIWTMNFGLRYAQVFDTENQHRFLPYANMQFDFKHNITLHASWNNAQRVPTFTELFYKSPTNQGNTDLKPELTSTTQIRLSHKRRGLYNEINSYYMRGKDMIDWVMFNAEDVYHSANFQLDNIGVGYRGEIDFAGFNPKARVKLGLGYQFIHQNRHDDIVVFKSLYALEYLKHKFNGHLTVEPVKNLVFTFDYRLVNRNGNYIVYKEKKNTGETLPYPTYGVADFKATYQYKLFQFFATVNNLFNKKYFDFGSVEQPGITGLIGVTFKTPGK